MNKDFSEGSWGSHTLAHTKANDDVLGISTMKKEK